MNLLRAISMKVVSTLLLTAMSSFIRALGQNYPIGEIVFFRGALAILPVIVVYAWRRELRGTLRMGRPLDHLFRGGTSAFSMYVNFTALSLIPLVDATAIQFTAPLMTVILAVLLLHEHVHKFRWTAVAIGFVGVIVMLIPHFDAAHLARNAASMAGAVGSFIALGGAVLNAGMVIQTRRMTNVETTSAIVFYFSLFSAVGGLVSLPWGWVMPTGWDMVMLLAIGILGGTAHLLLTDSYRYAPASTIAPFDYTAMLWAIALGYVMLGEVPNALVLLGAAIVVGAGLFVLWRERRVALQKKGG